MRPILIAIVLLTATAVLAGESVIYDDGVGAKISFYLPIHEHHDGQRVEYTTFRLTVIRDGRILLMTDLAGARSEDGKSFSGNIIIPSEYLNAAEILMLGSRHNSTLGVQKRLAVSSFRITKRDKSWTE